MDGLMDKLMDRIMVRLLLLEVVAGMWKTSRNGQPENGKTQLVSITFWNVIFFPKKGIIIQSIMSKIQCLIQVECCSHLRSFLPALLNVSFYL